MSITLELTELSPELEKQLTAMPEGERGKFVAALAEKGRQVEGDPAVWANSFGVEKGPLSPEAAAVLRATLDAPANEPTDAMKEAVEHWKKMTGYGIAKV